MQTNQFISVSDIDKLEPSDVLRLTDSIIISDKIYDSEQKVLLRRMNKTCKYSNQSISKWSAARFTYS